MIILSDSNQTGHKDLIRVYVASKISSRFRSFVKLFLSSGH